LQNVDRLLARSTPSVNRFSSHAGKVYLASPAVKAARLFLAGPNGRFGFICGREFAPQVALCHLTCELFAHLRHFNAGA
jgi:hypothetical protein